MPEREIIISSMKIDGHDDLDPARPFKVSRSKKSPGIQRWSGVFPWEQGANRPRHAISPECLGAIIISGTRATRGIAIDHSASFYREISYSEVSSQLCTLRRLNSRTYLGRRLQYRRRERERERERRVEFWLIQ